MTDSSESLREQVRDRYAKAAAAVLGSRDGAATATASSCGEGCCPPAPVELDPAFGSALYSATEQGELPIAAVAASLGCGNPTAVAELRESERVLDLGSGGGIDVLLSARRVGPTGFAFGVDMTDEMLELARANAAKPVRPTSSSSRGRSRTSPFPTRRSTW